MLNSFTKRMVGIIAPLEHERWVLEHISMGWRAGNLYETLVEGASKSEQGDLREQLRMHKLTLDEGADEETILAHYNTLDPRDQGKAIWPFNSMLKLMKKYDGVRIYRLKPAGSRTGRKNGNGSEPK